MRLVMSFKVQVSVHGILSGTWYVSVDEMMETGLPAAGNPSGAPVEVEDPEEPCTSPKKGQKKKDNVNV